MTIVFEPSYCNVYGTGYQLRYVYRNIDPGIAVEYIMGTSNWLSNSRLSQTSSRTTSSRSKNLGAKPRSTPQGTSKDYARYHSRHVRARTLEVGDLVLRTILSREGLHKLSPMWEGPFKVMHIARPGSARLETAEGVPVGNPWNIAHLQKFYP
jgi:hypothetical protein